MQKITFSTDSTADMGEELYKKYGFEVTRCGIIIGENTYTDGLDITQDDIYNAVENLKIMPSTAAINEADYVRVFKKSDESGTQHIHMALSDEFSASYANAVRAAKDFPNVHIFNTRTFTTGMALLCIMARELADEGKSVDEILKVLENTKHKVHPSFVLEGLKYLHRGGRCSGLKMIGANILGFHPQIIQSPEGKMVQGKIFRGKFPIVVQKYTDYTLETYPNACKDLVFITHSDVPKEIIDKVESDLKNAGFKKIYRTMTGCTVTAHCGRGTLGIILREK